MDGMSDEQQPPTPQAEEPNPLLNSEGTLPDPVPPLPGPIPQYVRERKKGEPRHEPAFPEAIINGRPIKYYSRPPARNPGSLPILAKDVAGLDKSALEPVEPPPKVVLKAWEKLGMDDKEWNKEAFRAAQEFGRYMNMKLTGRVLLTKGFNTIGQVQMAMKWAQEILASNHKDVEMFHKMTAAQLIPICAKAFKDLSEQLMDLAEKSQDKVSTDKPRNLPPSVALQVNLAGVVPSPAPASPATTDSNPQDTDTE